MSGETVVWVYDTSSQYQSDLINMGCGALLVCAVILAIYFVLKAESP